MTTTTTRKKRSGKRKKDKTSTLRSSLSLAFSLTVASAVVLHFRETLARVCASHARTQREERTKKSAGESAPSLSLSLGGTREPVIEKKMKKIDDEARKKAKK